MFGRYITSLSKFKLEEQLYFTAKANIMRITRLQHGLNATMKHIEDNGLTHLNEKRMKMYSTLLLHF